MLVTYPKKGALVSGLPNLKVRRTCRSLLSDQPREFLSPSDVQHHLPRIEESASFPSCFIWNRMLAFELEDG